MGGRHHGSDTKRIGGVMIVAAWILILGLLGLAFGDWLGELENPNQVVRANRAGDGRAEIVLRQNRSGHYVANGTINGVPVTFLLDTGATNVSVPARVASRIGLEPGAPVRTVTANGSLTTYLTRIDAIDVGGLRLGNVPAQINPGSQFEEVLLGMSFLKHFDFAQRDRALVIREPGPNRLVGIRAR